MIYTTKIIIVIISSLCILKCILIMKASILGELDIVKTRCSKLLSLPFCIFTERQTQKLKEETENLKMPKGFSQNHQLRRML